jgi:hypothetical protein
MWMERKLTGMKTGVPNWAASTMAGELARDITDLDQGIAEIKAANLAKHYERWHVPQLGHIELQRPDGVFCILGGQLNSASSLKVRTCKVDDVVCLVRTEQLRKLGNFIDYYLDKFNQNGVFIRHKQ